MIISIFREVGEMERNQIRKSQLDGIRVSRLKGFLIRRKTCSKEDVLSFLSKGKNKTSADY